MNDDDRKHLVNKVDSYLHDASRQMHSSNYVAATLSLINAASCAWRLHSPLQHSEPDKFVADWKEVASALRAMSPSVLRQSVKLLDEFDGAPPPNS